MVASPQEMCQGQHPMKVPVPVGAGRVCNGPYYLMLATQTGQHRTVAHHGSHYRGMARQ